MAVEGDGDTRGGVSFDLWELDRMLADHVHGAKDGAPDSADCDVVLV